MGLNENTGGLSDLQKRIIDELKENSRISFRELAKKLHFSAPTIAANLRELEESEVVQKYTVRLDHEKAGFMLRAIASVSVPLSEFRMGIDDILNSIPQVVRYYRVTGAFDYYVELAATSLSDLDHALVDLCRVGKTQTSIVLESHEKGCPSLAEQTSEGKP
ncbi:MAG: Lrp/AsnC family transcriptional regulator [Synergistaceae bacterium]|jgi:Lrp/AsnC family leucine-responsive transcriptional regulator|nr:Lrp/AsnC family transcriptional regulator [Synergistaceae bacterium]